MSIPQKDSSSYIFGAPRNHLDTQDLPSKYPMWNLAQTIQRSVGVVNLATKLLNGFGITQIVTNLRHMDH